MAQAIEIAVNAQEQRQGMEEQAHQRQMQMIQEDAKLKEAAEDKKFQNDIVLKRIDGEIKVAVAQTTALGRAADKDSDTRGIEEIKAASEASIKELGIQSKQTIEEAKTDRLREKDNMDQSIKLKELALKAQELKIKAEMKNKDVQIAAMNKN